VNIVVCVKEIADPEVASSVFSINEATQEVGPGVRFVISPFDAQAIEVALRIKDTVNEAAITLLTLGAESARSIMKYGLSLGADEAVMLIDPAFDRGDSYTTARALAAAIAKIGDVDLVLTGRQAADGDSGVVGLGIAELLGRPAVTFAMDVEVVDGALVIERALGDGAETVEAPMPAVVTVSRTVAPWAVTVRTDGVEARCEPPLATSAAAIPPPASRSRPSGRSQAMRPRLTTGGRAGGAASRRVVPPALS